jgi:hypothetical protein
VGFQAWIEGIEAGFCLQLQWLQNKQEVHRGLGKLNSVMVYNYISLRGSTGHI